MVHQQSRRSSVQSATSGVNVWQNQMGQWDAAVCNGSVVNSVNSTSEVIDRLMRWNLHV